MNPPHAHDADDEEALDFESLARSYGIADYDEPIDDAVFDDGAVVADDDVARFFDTSSSPYRAPSSRSGRIHAPPTDEDPFQSVAAAPPRRIAPAAPPAPPGLVPVASLPAHARTLFRFPFFNAVQSRCFDVAFKSDKPLVVSAPTGSGKTAVFELAVLRMLLNAPSDKQAIYVAPTKALCAERAQDWASRFHQIGCTVVELTGDSDLPSLKSVSHARIIVTTPEKWDSVTRRWREQSSSLGRLALFMLDEVHILGEQGRGPRLEVVVSRIKSFGTGVRFLGLSATAPNADDIARWLGKPAEPAELLSFGDEYRPCPLQKLVYGYPNPRNDAWSFTASLNTKLTGLIAQHAKGKPTLIFVATRKAASQVAEILAKEERPPWAAPATSQVAANFSDPKLKELASRGIAFHHAGVDLADRRAVEAAFLEGKIRVLCATTSLAVGVNLPAYCVIIRGTQQYVGSAWREMSEIDLVQMLGRAGRPQFDKDGVAIIMTEDSKRQRWEEMASGQSVIESMLHHELLEHVNAEIGLRGDCDLDMLQRWLRGTFLYVRMARNPSRYSTLASGRIANADPEAILTDICTEALAQLRKHEFVDGGGSTSKARTDSFASTELGKILSTYFLSFKTMLTLLEPREYKSTKDVLHALCLADEFHDIRIRQGERAFLDKLRSHPDIRYPMSKISGVQDKIDLLIQAQLGGISLSQLIKDTGLTSQGNPNADSFLILRHAPRILKALMDIAIFRGDGRLLRHGLELLRSICGKAWDGSPASLRQVDHIGEKSMRILSSSKVTSLAALASTDPRRIELLLSRRPPFGDQVLASARSLPRLSLEVVEKDPRKTDAGVQATFTVTVGLANPDAHTRSRDGQALHATILSVGSDDELFDCRRLSISKLREPKSFDLRCTLRRASQSVVIFAGCDTVSGSSVRAQLRCSAARSDFPSVVESDLEVPEELRGLTAADFEDRSETSLERDVPVAKRAAEGSKSQAKPSNPAPQAKPSKPSPPAIVPQRLPNGNFACNHPCKDKARCKHLCCRDGTSHPPRSNSGTNTRKKAQEKGAAELLRRAEAMSQAKKRPVSTWESSSDSSDSSEPLHLKRKKTEPRKVEEAVPSRPATLLQVPWGRGRTEASNASPPPVNDLLKKSDETAADAVERAEIAAAIDLLSDDADELDEQPLQSVPASPERKSPPSVVPPPINDVDDLMAWIDENVVVD